MNTALLAATIGHQSYLNYGVISWRWFGIVTLAVSIWFFALGSSLFWALEQENAKCFIIPPLIFVCPFVLMIIFG